MQAYQELGLLLVIVFVALLTYSSLVFFAEKDNGEGDYTSPQSFIITTTLGTYIEW